MTEPQPKPVRTVGELRALIADVPDDLAIHVSYHVAAAITLGGYFITEDAVLTGGVDAVPGEPPALCLWTESFYEGSGAL